ncbi:MAG: hypothetical protein FRX49_11910 [Trebouxia sp. A1-2]|nr:MAG: hypothetical protein FRX49_11910 [Trebouxia sp. A1-2]
MIADQLANAVLLSQDLQALGKKETTVFGDLVDDDAQLQDIPEPGQQDFWEGEKWEWLGKLSFVLVPLLVLLAVLVGAFAAKTYDSGASTFLAPPSPEDATVKLIPGRADLPAQ